MVRCLHSFTIVSPVVCLSPACGKSKWFVVTLHETVIHWFLNLKNDAFHLKTNTFVSLNGVLSLRVSACMWWDDQEGECRAEWDDLWFFRKVMAGQNVCLLFLFIFWLNAADYIPDPSNTDCWGSLFSLRTHTSGTDWLCVSVKAAKWTELEGKICVWPID